MDQDIAVNISDTKNKKPVSSGLSVNESPNGSLEEEGDRNLLASSFISSRQRRSHASVETNSQQLDEVIFRKILIIPARFNDETEDFISQHSGGPNAGTNNPLTNDLGEHINNEINADPFDLISRPDLENTMKDVVEFYSRNTDRKVQLIPVISSTCQLSTNRFISTVSTGDGATFYDTDGNATKIAQRDYWGSPDWTKVISDPKILQLKRVKIGTWMDPLLWALQIYV